MGTPPLRRRKRLGDGKDENQKRNRRQVWLNKGEMNTLEDRQQLAKYARNIGRD